MRFILWISFFLILNGVLHGQHSYDRYASALLLDVINDIEEKNGVTFSYDSKSIDNYSVDLIPGEYSLEEVLAIIFRQTRLEYEILDDRHILISPIKVSQDMRYLCGYIYAGNEPIIFATVANSDMSNGVLTDTLGYFKIPVSESDRLVSVSYLGYEPLIIPLNSNVGSDCESYSIEERSIEFETVVLTEYLSDGITQSEQSNAIIIGPEEMDLLPGSIEPDVFSTIQFLPGIVSTNEALDGLNVRGGTPDQNLVLYDGIPMFHTSHFFGSISAFNPFIIDEVDVYRSGIGSEYGGRVSSVIDINSDSKIADDFDIEAGVNLTHVYLNSNIPLWKGSSILISTRRSITEIWNTPTFVKYAEKVFQGTKVDNTDFNNNGIPFNDEFRFNDGNLKWMWETGKNKFALSTVGALNRLNYRAELPEIDAFSVDFLNLRNGGYNLSWDRNWNERFSSSLELTNSEYNYDYNLSYRRTDSITSPPPVSIDVKNKITEGGLKWTNDLILENGQKIKFGYQFTENRIDFISKSKNFGEINENGILFKNDLHALFSQYSLTVPKLLHIDVGLRYAYSNEIKNNYFEPRISLAIDVTEDFKLKIGTSKHFQFISQLVVFNINQLDLNNQVWVASNNKEIPVIESNQWMGGAIYKKDNWTLDIEGYVKELDGITTLTNNFVSLPEQPPFSIGKSRIRGIDALLKRRVGRYRTWLSYTLSQSLYDFILLTPEAIPASHDQTSVIQWVHTYKRKNWEFSAGWQHRTGLPTTKATGVTSQTNMSGGTAWKIEYEPINSSRLAAYRKLDVSIVYNFGDKSKLHGFVGFSFQNLLNRDNVVSRQYILGEPDVEGVPEILEIVTLGLKATPNLSINIRY